jgi:hypothetical protein
VNGISTPYYCLFGKKILTRKEAIALRKRTHRARFLLALGCNQKRDRGTFLDISQIEW